VCPPLSPAVKDSIVSTTVTLFEEWYGQNKKNGHLFEEGHGQEELDVVLRYAKVSKETRYIGKRALIHRQTSPYKVASTGHTFHREHIQ
jgi:hypothetical protein